MQAGTRAEIDEIGFRSPDMVKTETLEAGEVGYIITGIKDVAKLRVGDTLTTESRPAAEPLPGYREARPVVFCGLYPIDTDQYADLRDALEKLRSTTPRSPTSPRRRRRSGSASAAASSGCCTWTSCASGWSASTTSTCSPRRRTSSTACG